MFLCQKCHEKEANCAWKFHLFHSQGRCEDCGNVAVCVDCTAYKRHPKPQ